MRTACKAVLLLSLLSLWGHAQAQTKDAVTMQSLHAKALAFDAAYAAARLAYEADSQYEQLAKRAFLPSISLSATADRNDYQVQELASPTLWQERSHDPSQTKITLTQRLLDKSRSAQQDESWLRYERSHWIFKAAQQDLVQRLLKVYVDYLLAQDQLTLAQAQHAAYQRQHKELEAMLVSRSVTRTEVAEAKARMDIAQVQIHQSETALVLAQRQFAKVTGVQNPQEVRPFVNNPKLELPSPGQVEHWVAQAMQNNPEIRAQEYQARLAEVQIARVKAGYYPNVLLSASQSKGNHANYQQRRDRISSVGVQLTMNLFDGGNTTSQMEQAVLQAESQKQTLLDMQRDIEARTTQAYWEAHHSVAQVKAAESAVQAATLALEGVRMGIKASIRTYTDELNTVQQLYSAKRQLQNERYRYLQARVNLAALAGGVTEASVQDIDRLMAVAR